MQSSHHAYQGFAGDVRHCLQGCTGDDSADEGDFVVEDGRIRDALGVRRDDDAVPAEPESKRSIGFGGAES